MKIILIFIFFSLFSCQNKNHTIEEFKSLKESFILPVDNLSSNRLGIRYRQTPDGIAYLNRSNHSIDFLSKTNSTKRVLLKKDGPNQISSPQGVFISDEKIFISEQFSFKLLNQSGEIKEKFKLNLTDEFITPNFSGFNQPHLSDNTIYFMATSYLNPLMGLGDNTGLIIKLDLETSEYEFILQYPEELITKDIYSIDYYVLTSSIIRKDKIILNFPFTEDLFYSNDFKTWKKKEVKSAAQKSKIRPYKNDLNNMMANKEHYGSNGIYTPIIDDPYRNLYYRIYSEPKEHGSGDKSHERHVYLLICDEKFNIIKEIKLPDLLSYLNFYVNHEGLYFQDLNNQVEDEIEFVKVYPSY